MNFPQKLLSQFLENRAKEKQIKKFSTADALFAVENDDECRKSIKNP
ncbi:hypothetical protein ACX12E_22680 [Paenibacillus vandeheii]